jgi:hypothetical protein
MIGQVIEAFRFRVPNNETFSDGWISPKRHPFSTVSFVEVIVLFRWALSAIRDSLSCCNN